MTERASRPDFCTGFRARRCQSGYTMVELIMVIVLIAILSSIAGPRFFSNSAFDERRYLDELASAIRYAQKVAVATGCPVRVTVTANSYLLGQQPESSGHCNTSSSDYSTPVLLPTGQTAAGNAPADTVLSNSATFLFDATGRTSLPGDVAMVIGSHTLTVRSASGLVTTQ